jgi:hypothetical protein
MDPNVRRLLAPVSDDWMLSVPQEQPSRRDGRMWTPTLAAGHSNRKKPGGCAMGMSSWRLAVADVVGASRARAMLGGPEQHGSRDEPCAGRSGAVWGAWGE